MKVRIREHMSSDAEPASEEELETELIYKKIMQMYKETGECPYCGSSVKIDNEEDNYVLDAGWYNHLKCRMCNLKPSIKPTIHYEILQKVLKNI